MKKYKHLSFEERFTIEKLIKRKRSLREIAVVLGRSPNTISYELRKNSVKGIYSSKKARYKAYYKRWRSKRGCLKVSMSRFLTKFVEKHLVKRWSPKQISGYLKETHGITCSDKAIYKYVRSRCLERYLFWSWNRKKSGRKRYCYNNIKDQRKYIEDRVVLDEIGHLEADFIVSRESKYSFLVVVDKLTKLTSIKKIPNRKHETVSHAFCEMFKGKVLKTLTLDNDISFAHWKQLERRLKTKIYFTHPYHSWEKGLVENANRWIRCFVPKKRDIASVTQKELEEILSFLNNRPREIIRFRKPAVYYKQLTECPT